MAIYIPPHPSFSNNELSIYLVYNDSNFEIRQYNPSQCPIC